MKGERELRCYTFTIYQLSSIQQGIQAGHAAVELMLKYHNQNYFDLNMVSEWAHYWKTMICLNAGDLSDLHDWIMFLSIKDNMYPWTPFYESPEALDGIPTSVAIILPEDIFGTAEKIRKQIPFTPARDFSAWETDMMNRLNASSMAR